MPHFTVDEAHALLPWLTEQLARLVPLLEERERLRAEVARAQMRVRTNGGSPHAGEEAARLKELEAASSRADGLLKEVAEKGIVLRDPARGLVDFPSLREGREIHLCWLKGEECIAFWHEVDAGFAGRQPL
ncbi:MAG: DUF2203 family protein [Dehalococcoidia bacterium]|nr:DUF2203 family protein [Dehalococcoidia bacterium]